MDRLHSSFIHVSYLQQMKRSGAFTSDSKKIIGGFLQDWKARKQLLEEEVESHTAALASMDCVEWADIETLVAQIEQSEPAGWSTRFAEAIGVAAHGPLGFAALSAENLFLALDLFQNYLATRLNFFSIEIAALDSDIAILLKPRLESSSATGVMQELLCASVILLIDAMLDVEMEQVKISSKNNQGLQNLCERWSIAHGPGADLVIQFPAAWLELPSFYADATAFETNLIRCQQQKQLLEQLATPFTARIDRLLESFFVRQAIDFEERGVINPAPTIDSLAKEFFVSSRTLMRRLKNENASYKLMLQAHRTRLAESYLSRGDSVEAVAHKLAYSDAGNFIRAFQEWKGLTPALWRKSNAE